MGHETVTGFGTGTTNNDLRDLVATVADAHHDNYGYYHSVDTTVDIVRPGVVSKREFVHSDDRYFAQLVYSDDDIVTREHHVALPIASIGDYTQWGALTRAVDAYAAEKGLGFVTWRTDQTKGTIKPGLSGTMKVKHTTGKSKTKTVYRAQVGATVYERDTMTEIREAVAAAMLTTMSSASAIEKVTRREDGPLTSSELILSRGRAHVIITTYTPRKGAKAVGWGVALDCHH